VIVVWRKRPAAVPEALKPPTNGVFISYRRTDDLEFKARLNGGGAAKYPDAFKARITERHPGSRVFMDTDSIDLGLDFTEVLPQAVKSSTVLVAFIGPLWATMTDARGIRRLDMPHDWVAVEILTALQNKVRMIPVLVNGAKQLEDVDLPAGLESLRHLQSLTLGGKSADRGLDRLIEQVGKILGIPRDPQTYPKHWP
jgi:hypothetical protein